MLIATIISGGAGSRLWPVSRETHPKPFMKLADGQNLLQKTFLRAAALPDVREVLTVTNHELYFKTRDAYREVRPQPGRIGESFLLEPFGRNTAPAIALAALETAAVHGPEAVMLVLPADHLIDQVEAFAQTVARAKSWAERGVLVTLGIAPTSPETGFGYIECGPSCAGGTACEVARFVEKPGLDRAREFLAAGNYLWNSGMFCFRAGVFLEQLGRHAPELLERARACWTATAGHGGKAPGVFGIDAETFARIPQISIDYALMEKSDAIVVVPAEFDWNDVGSWESAGRLAEPDGRGNRVVGEVILIDSDNSFIQSEGRMVAAVGLSNLVVIDTPDALLVADRNRVQDVKQVVEELKRRNHESVRLHQTVARPWGTYTVLEESDNFKIKRIVVKPGAALSLQMHHHRSEHWVVVSGTAKVTNNGETYVVRTNESTYISAGHKHRLENAELADLVIIEVQSGEYVGEDDIVRIDDVYGRA